MQMNRTLILASGGIDSTTCVAQVVSKLKVDEDPVCMLIFEYGQKHTKEIDAALNVAKYYKDKVVPYILDIKSLFQEMGSTKVCSLFTNSELTLPQGAYKSRTEEKLPSTYVPFRNGIFLSIATSFAFANKYKNIMYGVHRDDIAAFAYPDCSISFINSMDSAIKFGTSSEVYLQAPFMGWNKAEVVAEGLKLNAPYHLTWSCYTGDKHPCGKCATCIDRARAFELNDVEDPANV